MLKETYPQDTIGHNHISEQEIAAQKAKLLNGAAYTNIQRACTVGDGIIQISEDEKRDLIANYENHMGSRTINRFTPASGAATRMFKHLMQNDLATEKADFFFNHLKGFAFYPALKELGVNDSMTKDEVLSFLLTEKGLNYAQLPKALILFHTYANGAKTSVIEQLDEGVQYATQNGEVHFHFTLSPQHVELVQMEIENYRNTFESTYGVSLNVSYSVQSKSTDTVALDAQNNLVQQPNGELLFRPGGHGALIHNLNGIEQDLVFIKNIDNVVTASHQSLVVDYKKMLGAVTASKQQIAFALLTQLDQEHISTEELAQIAETAKKELNVIANPTVADLRKGLNRPIRICGMVKNEGQPGGGPFWVDNTIQIVEGAQLDMANTAVDAMVQKATHFNPVDIVCGLKNYKGEKFDLTEYIDHEAYFTASKSYNGAPITVLEHPGLWNGAMANWITLFVETPIETFAPVKSVNDLIHPLH